MRLLAFALFALFVGTGPAAAWEEYIYLDQGVAIQFPAKPQAMKSTYDTVLARGLSSMVYSVEDDHVLYRLTAVDLTSRPHMGANFLNEAAFQLMRRGNVLSTDFPRVYFDEKSIYGVTLVVDRMDGTRERTSFYCNKGRLYIVEAIVLPARGDKDLVTPSRFDQSIRFPPDNFN